MDSSSVAAMPLWQQFPRVDPYNLHRAGTTVSKAAMSWRVCCPRCRTPVPYWTVWPYTREKGCPACRRPDWETDL